MTQLSPGSTATAFALPDVEGRQVGFDPAAPGKKVLVFYKVTCPTCQLGMPYYDRLFQRFSGTGIPFFAIVQDPADAAESFAGTYGITMPQLIDAAPYPVSDLYKLISVPTLFVLGEGGVVELASPAFVKADVEKAAALLSEAAGGQTPAIFEESEDVPAMQPG